ncbi:MAG TPA: hypothetical protein G4O15_05140 [Dehalococcoidia bacterium]|nr:hypothetical protein [Dehalococcoidia bacterium]
MKNKSTKLYDVGGWFIIAIVFGIGIVGVIIDYFWNYLIFHLSLRRLDLIIPLGKKIIYCLVITALGLFIDWLYYELVWGTLSVGPVRIEAAFPRAGSEPVLEIITIFIPMILIASVNYIVSRLFLKVTNHEGLVISIIMGVFTAPWLIMVFVVTKLFT